MGKRKQNLSRDKKVMSLGSALQKIVEAYSLDNKLRENQVIANWAEIIGPVLAAVTAPIRVKDGILYLKVKNDVWRNELHFQKDQILKAIEKHLEKRVIHEIVMM